MHQSSSRLRVVSCIPQCVLVQTSAIGHGELRRLAILPCNQTFHGLFCGCRRCGILCCRLDTFWSEQGSNCECEPVSCALMLFWVDNGSRMTVGSGAHIQVSNHSQDQCACMSEVLKEFESEHASRVMTRDFASSRALWRIQTSEPSPGQPSTVLTLDEVRLSLSCFKS